MHVQFKLLSMKRMDACKRKALVIRDECMRLAHGQPGAHKGALGRTQALPFAPGRGLLRPREAPAFVRVLCLRHCAAVPDRVKLGRLGNAGAGGQRR